MCEPAVVISPVSEKELDELEEKLAVQLPCDYQMFTEAYGKLSIPLGTVNCVVMERNKDPKLTSRSNRTKDIFARDSCTRLS